MTTMKWRVVILIAVVATVVLFQMFSFGNKSKNGSALLAQKALLMDSERLIHDHNPLEEEEEVGRLLVHSNYKWKSKFVSYSPSREKGVIGVHVNGRTGDSDLVIDIEYNVGKLTASQEVTSAIITPPIIQSREDGPQILMKVGRILLDSDPGSQSQFTMLRLLDERDSDIGSLVCKCLSVGSVPVILASKEMEARVETLLPFNQVIDWSRAILKWRLQEARRPGGLSEEEVKRRLQEIPKERHLELRRVGHRIFWHYMSSLDAVLDTTMAVARDMFRRPAPFHAPVMPNHATHYVQNGKSEEESPEEKWSWQRKAPDYSRQEMYDRWNVEFYPWQRIPVENPRYARRPMEVYSEDVDDDDPSATPAEQFTVVFMTYKRHSLIKDAIALFKGIRELHRVVIVWNDFNHTRHLTRDEVGLDVEGASVVVVSPSANSLNNRLAPYDVIQTECVLQIDDDTRYLTKEQIKHGFRVWQQNRDRLVGFMARSVMQTELGSAGNSWAYVAEGGGRVQSVLLTTALFHHIYYSYRYTFEFSPGMRAVVDEMTNCEDIFVNAMVADDRGAHGIMADRWMEYSCIKGCGKTPENSISMSQGHYDERTKCVDTVYNYYGYMPLQASNFYAAELR